MGISQSDGGVLLVGRQIIYDSIDALSDIVDEGKICEDRIDRMHSQGDLANGFDNGVCVFNGVGVCFVDGGPDTLSLHARCVKTCVYPIAIERLDEVSHVVIPLDPEIRYLRTLPQTYGD